MARLDGARWKFRHGVAGGGLVECLVVASCQGLPSWPTNFTGTRCTSTVRIHLQSNTNHHQLEKEIIHIKSLLSSELGKQGDNEQRKRVDTTCSCTGSIKLNRIAERLEKAVIACFVFRFSFFSSPSSRPEKL